MQLSDRIKKIRKHLGWSQMLFSVTLGVSNGHISKLEKGTAQPSEQLINLICSTFGIDKKWLLSGHGEFKIRRTSNITNKEAREILTEDMTEFKYDCLYNNLRLLSDTISRFTKHFSEQDCHIGRIDDFILDPGHYRNEQIIKVIEGIEENIGLLNKELKKIKELKTFNKKGEIVPVSPKK